MEEKRLMVEVVVDLGLGRDDFGAILGLGYLSRR